VGEPKPYLQIRSPWRFFVVEKKNRHSGRNPFYDSMTQISIGNIVLLFSDTYIKAIGIAQRSAITSPNPDFRTPGGNTF
jgi:hypothetical protein